MDTHDHMHMNCCADSVLAIGHAICFATACRLRWLEVFVVKRAASPLLLCISSLCECLESKRHKHTTAATLMPLWLSQPCQSIIRRHMTKQLISNRQNKTVRSESPRVAIIPHDLDQQTQGNGSEQRTVLQHRGLAGGALVDNETPMTPS